MEKQSKKTDIITQGLIKEGGLHKPSAKFVDNVMDAVTQLKKEQEIYHPLISKNAWIVLIFLIATIVVILSVFSNIDYTLLSNYDLFDKPFFNVTLPEMKFSKEVIYGIGFLGLFLLQIPILKRQLDKRYI